MNAEQIIEAIRLAMECIEDAARAAAPPAPPAALSSPPCKPTACA